MSVKAAKDKWLFKMKMKIKRTFHVEKWTFHVDTPEIDLYIKAHFVVFKVFQSRYKSRLFDLPYRWKKSQ